MIGERQGVPSIAVITTAFEDGAHLMAGALGAAGYRFAVITHPISSATDADLEAKAADTVAQATRLLLP